MNCQRCLNYNCTCYDDGRRSFYEQSFTNQNRCEEVEVACERRAVPVEYIRGFPGLPGRNGSQ